MQRKIKQHSPISQELSDPRWILNTMTLVLLCLKKDKTSFPVYAPHDGGTCCLVKDVLRVPSCSQLKAFCLVMKVMPCLPLHICLTEIRVCGLQPMERLASDKETQTKKPSLTSVLPVLLEELSAYGLH